MDKTILKRDGSVVPFEGTKIQIAILKNMLDVRGMKGGSAGNLSQADQEMAARIYESVLSWCASRHLNTIPIEDIQDRVELEFMRAGEQKMARAYVLYREHQAAKRSQGTAKAEKYFLVKGQRVAFDTPAMAQTFDERFGHLNVPKGKDIAERVERQIFDGCNERAVRDAILLVVREGMEMYPDATFMASRLVIDDLCNTVLGDRRETDADAYRSEFAAYVAKGIKHGLLDPKLSQIFDLERLSAALQPNRDDKFDYLGIQTLADRYLLSHEDVTIELPQWMFMRVAMGVSINEIDATKQAIEFYNLISSFDYMPSTPTLFNSGTTRPQLSSCFLTSIDDDLDAIYSGIKDNALLQKFAGGVGNDWTRVRALGSHIKGTNGKSQGVIPFLKVANDTAVAVNQGGKRKGAVCAYMETWHLDIEEFLELRKNTGDDRRRTHDMNTANWVPDLFMQRVREGGQWTLVSPSDAPELHSVYGKQFAKRYVEMEARCDRGEIKNFRRVAAQDLWRKMLTMLFETGHPWMTFKDVCNLRSPQQHVGVVNGSNLCTEITLNTSNDEIAVCNLGSVNLVAFVKQDGTLDHARLKKAVQVAMRMLDNVIDVNYYSVAKARNSNLRHRPVGLGIMGFHEALQRAGVAYASELATKMASQWQEAVSLYAYLASTELAEERGKYATFSGSLWDQGVLPHDSIRLLEDARGMSTGVTPKETLPEWQLLRDRIKRFGMRNSNCCAIAPTATISNIVGVSQSIDPVFQNLYVKSNLSGEFTMVNRVLVAALSQEGLWDQAMAIDLKAADGSLGAIRRVPDRLKRIFATAFEIDPRWLIDCAAYRQAWIDQAQSLNLYMAGASGKKLAEMYMLAWERGLKTTYYLRCLSASSAEKSTLSKGELNAVQSALPVPEVAGAVCTMSPGDPGFESCEACQ